MGLIKFKQKSILILLMLVCTLAVFCFPTSSIFADQTEWNFSYTGGEQEFTPTMLGYYQLEVWGAQGGTGRYGSGGYGGYSTSTIVLDETSKLYINVGGKGVDNTSGTSYNGGSSSNPGNCPAGGGGGASHVALSSGLLYTFSSNRSNLLIVAGGGGGAGSSAAGHGGGCEGTTSGNDWTYAPGGTQLTSPTNARGNNAGGFGYGGTGLDNGGAGGGGGYYGGAGGWGSGAGGGSGYIGNDSLVQNTSDEIINKMFCYNCTESNDMKTYTVSTKGDTEHVTERNTEECSDGYSSDPVSACAKAGNGHVKITLVNTFSDNNYLSSLFSESGDITPSISHLINDYYLTIPKYDSHFTIDGETEDEYASVIGFGTYEIEVGETKNIEITVTAGNGDVNNYVVHVTRESLAEGEHSTKLKSLSIQGYTEILEPVFYPLINEYEIEIDHEEIYLNITAQALDPSASIAIEGHKYIPNESGIITITVTESHSENSIYTISYQKSESNNYFDFEYKGEPEVFIVPHTGLYKLEVWGGAGGGGYNTDGGNGGYSSGYVNLNKNQELTIIAGGKGQGINSTSYNTNQKLVP